MTTRRSVDLGVPPVPPEPPLPANVRPFPFIVGPHIVLEIAHRQRELPVPEGPVSNGGSLEIFVCRTHIDHMEKAARPVAVAYIRVSTAGQASEGVSLAAQRARLEAWATSGGLELAAVHEDAGLSGSKAANRPALQAALSEVCRRKGVLVVYSLSRLARSTRDALAIAERLDKAGADLVSLSEQIDTTSAAGKMVFRMLAVLAEFERDLISERTRSAMSHMRRQGRRISGRIPFGSDLVGDRLVENPKEAAALALMHRLRADGRSLRQIAAELKRRNVLAKNGGLWSAKVISFVLRRDAEARRAA